MKRWRFAAAVAAALLAACGGGGSSSNSAATVSVPQGTRSVAASAGSDVSAANTSDLGATAARAVLSATAGGIFDVTGAGRESPQALTTTRSTASLPAHLVRAALRLAAPVAAAAREQPQASSSQTLPCPDASGSFTGSMTISFVDADNNGKLSNGDGLTLALVDCVVDSGLPEANGSFTMAINIVELDSANDPVAIDVSVTFNSFSMDGLGTFSGSFLFWSRPEGSGERFRISYRSTAVQQGPVPVVYNFDVYGSSSDSGGSFDIGGGITVGGVTFSIVGGDVFSFIGGSPPHLGSLRLVDVAGDAVRLTARSASLFDLDFFPFGALIPGLSLPGLLWSDFGG